ncbi:MAG: signal peptide peptidase SppA, partial [Myxococcota bacterium]
APGNPLVEARNALIDDRLKQQVLAQFGLAPTPEAIEEGMTNFAQRAELSREEFIQALGENGVSEETFRDFVTIGAFKTAPEPFLRESMSDAQRQQVTALVDGLYTHLLSIISKRRKLTSAEAKAVLDQGVFSASQAKRLKLVDEVFYRDQVVQEILKAENVKKMRFVAKYGLKKVEPPSSIWSIFSMLTKSGRKALDPQRPKIAVVYAEGAIMHGAQDVDPFGDGGGIWSDTMLKTLKRVAKLKNLKAVVLRVNSPGGSALASDLIWRRLELLKKKVPLVVSMGNVAASGGYYIAMGADRLFAQPSTITGSIGVFGGKVVLRGTMQKIGISVESVSRGKSAGMFSAFEKFSASDRAALRKTMQATYADFVRKAAKGRKMKEQDLLKLAGGRVWTGQQALNNKLVDQLGDLLDAIEWARKHTGLGKKTQIVYYPRPKSFFESLQEIASVNPQKTLPYALQRVARQLVHLPKAWTSPLRMLLDSKQTLFFYAHVPSIELR